jgi:hypothetical protein
VGIGSPGCLHVYRSETVWHADGSVDRAIYQDWNATPDSMRGSKAWQQTTSAPDPQKLDRQGWSGPISTLPVRPGSDGGSYFAAWGRFPSPRDIPVHFVHKAPENSGVADAELVRDCHSTDYVFVREFRWRETLTDVVKFEEMRSAREQLADLLIDFGRDSFDEAYGRDYDINGLVSWLRTEGKTWLAELTDYAYLHAAARKGRAAFSENVHGMAEICARHGLALQANGKYLGD